MSEVKDTHQQPVYVLAFESTHAAMAAEKAFCGTGAALIPTPRAISAGCGMSLKFAAENDSVALSRVRSVEAVRNLSALYRAEGEGYVLSARL